LAWEAARDDIHKSAPWQSVKSANVIPDWERLECFVVLPRFEDFAAIGVDFNGADGAPSEEVRAEQATASACEQCQLIHFILAIFRRFFHWHFGQIII
jgi:hypothetical protein